MPESLLGHFNSFWVSVELGARPLLSSKRSKPAWNLESFPPCFFSCFIEMQASNLLEQVSLLIGARFSGKGLGFLGSCPQILCEFQPRILPDLVTPRNCNHKSQSQLRSRKLFPQKSQYNRSVAITKIALGQKNRCDSESHTCSRNDFWGVSLTYATLLKHNKTTQNSWIPSPKGWLQRVFF